jgi:hypothetical protein
MTQCNLGLSIANTRQLVHIVLCLQYSRNVVKMTAKVQTPHAAHKMACPSLPAEVCITIFRYHTDLAHLWLACRRVSPTLRACVEYAFSEYFLKDIHIDFQLEKYNLGGKSKRPEVSTAFARRGLGKEKEIAWYKDDRPDLINGTGIFKSWMASHGRRVANEDVSTFA